ncbi:uncharacterized protein LOC131434546 [Malaya genurostris]|uniref:uncharacterized protein LOC131434546 n=1 Tax=Malaya genurostris TaxID=325434 RepID=UPI0026F38879|nr:uncharacterized protein LOC131434546 [Malaya genurostris]XP_058457346.1 uncharacterized protein LOC131434546 [Malaya genurostris]XP_058457347.1 uncharacterized protein LOC131434546 [Malaya genurostris]XP_058457348.1 uncharacterized protein LOC131434546 [Malaya genurostris]
MGTGVRKGRRPYLIPTAKRALYHRLFRKLCKRSYQRRNLGKRRSKLLNLYSRLMHKQFLTHGLNARHRGHCLVLDKRFGAPCKGTIPSYFRKRLLKRRFEEKYSSNENEPNERVIAVDDDCGLDTDSSNDDTVLVDEEDRHKVERKKHPEIPDPTKFSILKQEIKEYCAVQEKIQIVLSMLKSRANELMNEHDSVTEDVDRQEEANNLHSEVKCEETDFDAAELESLAEKYYNSDDDDVKEVKTDENDESVEVEEESSKPEIVFVDMGALDDSSCNDLEQVDSKDNLIIHKSLKDISKIDLLDPTFSTIKLEPVDKKHSVVDSLFSKFNLKLPDSPSKSTSNTLNEEEEKIIGRLRDRRKTGSKPCYVDDEVEPKKVRPSKIFDKIHKKLNIELANSNSNSSTEFYGFDEGEVVKLDKPSVPGLLPTPIVKKSRPNAPFLAHGTCFEDIKIENRDDLFREEGLISFGSLPPRLECPRRPDDMVRPRTVAQKRILLQKKNDVRYLMIDNESKIFYELEKRSKNIDAELDFERMQELQDQNIPFTRDTWRALAWLRTEKGRYYFQTLRVDNHSIKLSGCRGNHFSKRHSKKQLSAPVTVPRKHVCRCPELPTNIEIDLSAIAPPGSTQVVVKPESEESACFISDADKKLLCSSTNRMIITRPGPLSSKLRNNTKVFPHSEEDAYLGPLEILEMPRVEIEVFPRIDRPLDPTVKPYLKMILPFRGITEKWARFSVSTLKTPDRDETDSRSFSFSLPYNNNQHRLLIRRRLLESTTTMEKHTLSAESLQKFEAEQKLPLTFRKHLEEPSEPVDPVEKECADILAEMTDAVAIGLAEDLFIGQDPDGDYTKEDKPVHKPACIQDNVGKSSECAAKSKRMIREMKRLNATIIESIPQPLSASGALGDDSKLRCDQQYCSKGCICDVFTGGRYTTSGNKNHCSKIDCIFGCDCGYEKKRTASVDARKDSSSDLREDGLSSLSNEDVKYLREKATARLAKEEREFTPTVIMTTNSTVLVRNTEMEARRHKKKPKKYDDYYNGDNVRCIINGIIPDEGEPNPRDVIVERVKPKVAIDRPLSTLEKIRHSHVVLNKLQDLDEIEAWCMVHCLYRCYCRGNATSGKPFKFNEESNIVLPTPAVTPAPDALLQVYEPRRRRLYSFEKPDEMMEEIQPPVRKRDSSEESYKPWSERRKKKRRTIEEHSEPSTLEAKCASECVSTSTRASIEDLQITDGQTCRRVIPANRNFYKTRNYYRKERYQRDIAECKRKNPFADKRLRQLLERCEKSFINERKQEIENSMRNTFSSVKTPPPKRTQEPIYIDIVGDDLKIEKHSVLSPLMDSNKVLIFCGKKKYYVESESLENGKLNLMNIAKKFRTTVYVIKKVLDEPLAKNITFSYKDESITVRGRAYRKNLPYEQSANEHVDLNSNCDSEEQLSTPSLVQESGSESDAQKLMLDQVNSDIMHTMQHIREMLRKNTLKLNPPKKGILYLFRWEKFLQAFNEELLDVWDIKFQNGTELVVITTDTANKSTPSFKNTKSVRLVRRCTFDTKEVSLLTQMVVYQLSNPETNKLSLVLFGTENYWRFCGFIKSSNDSLNKGVEVRPTPTSHPKLAPKINRYFEAFVASRKVKAETVAVEFKQPVAPTPEAPLPIKDEEPIPTPHQKQHAIPTKISTFKTNVKLMETKIKDFKNIAIPNVGTRRWFMLNVINDFSDIYIPSWKSCLTYGRIRQAIQLANRYGKTVKLTSIVLKNNQEDVLPQIYAAPGQGDCIFLGPYTYTQNIDLMLCQNVDGKMYTREEYERNNHIVRTEQTTGSWLYMKPIVQTAAAHLQAMTKIAPPSQIATVASTSNDDCVVIDDDDDVEDEPTKDESNPSRETDLNAELCKNNNSQLESLIHQLYDNSDSDDGIKTETSPKHSTSKPLVSQTVTADKSTKNNISLLVDKTIAESKQLRVTPVLNDGGISSRQLSPSVDTISNGASIEHVSRNEKTASGKDTNILKRKSLDTIERINSSPPKTKTVRSSLPSTSYTADEVVCLDDDDEDDSTKNLHTKHPPKTKIPSSTTILNSQQAALIASKINLLNPNQKGVVYNPSTGVLRIKRSVMNSITAGSPLSLPAIPSSSKQSPSSTSPAKNLPEKSPTLKSIPTSARNVQESMTTLKQSLQKPPAISQLGTSANMQQSIVKPPKVPTEGILRSNIPGLGLVPVLWSSKDIIIKVRELSVKHQFVRLFNFEAAILLLNRFIRKNTYTFKPFSLTIGWKFEPRSTPLPAEENLINTISLRCIVSPDGVIDLYKASEIVAFQNTKPNFYEELLLLRLSILCCKKDQYEQEKCHKFFENIFIKAAATIRELKSASEALTTQSTFLREQQAERRAYLATLEAKLGKRSLPSVGRMVSKRVSVPKSILDCVSQSKATSTSADPKPADSISRQQKEAVIVIDDD